MPIAEGRYAVASDTLVEFGTRRCTVTLDFDSAEEAQTFADAYDALVKDAGARGLGRRVTVSSVRVGFDTDACDLVIEFEATRLELGRFRTDDDARVLRDELRGATTSALRSVTLTA